MGGKLWSGGNRVIGFIVVTFVLSLGGVQVAEATVQCYVCSWQSPLPQGNTNFTDMCSHYNFDPAYSRIIDCEGGCEAVTIRPTKNGNITNFYKNCIPVSKSRSRLEDKCASVETTNRYETTCECTSNLCNTASRLPGFSGVAGILVVNLFHFVEKTF